MSTNTAPARRAAQSETAPATTNGATGKITRRVSEILAEHLGLEPEKMLNVIKAQCFKGIRPDQVTNEMLAAYVNVANSLREQAPNFNPLLPGMLYAYPTKNGGVEPMIGPDGIFAMLSSRPDVTGWDTVAEVDDRGNLVSVEATINVAGRTPFRKRCYLSEWKVGTNPNWQSRPTHMLELRALKQCARYIIHGIPLDEDERSIIEVEAQDLSKPQGSRVEHLARRIVPPAPLAAEHGNRNYTEPEEAEQEKPKGGRKAKKDGGEWPAAPQPEPSDDEGADGLFAGDEAEEQSEDNGK